MCVIFLGYTWYIPVIFLVYSSHIIFNQICIYLEYTWYLVSESLPVNPGRYLDYTSYMPAHFKSRNSTCSRIAIGMQLHTNFGSPGCLLSLGLSGAPSSDTDRRLELASASVSSLSPSQGWRRRQAQALASSASPAPLPAPAGWPSPRPKRRCRPRVTMQTRTSS